MSDVGVTGEGLLEKVTSVAAGGFKAVVFIPAKDSDKAAELVKSYLNARVQYALVKLPDPRP